MSDITGEMIRAAKDLADKRLKRDLLKVTLDLIGFGWTSIGIAWLCISPPATWKAFVGLAAGWLMGAFAWRFVTGFWNIILTFIVAAQKGTILALSLSQNDLDKWDCGDPSCEGCKARREKNA